MIGTFEIDSDMDIQDYIEISHIFWKGLARSTLIDEGLFAVATGMSNFYLNPVLTLKDIKQLPKIEAFYHNQHLAWSLYLETEVVDQTLLWDLQGEGFKLKDTAVAMKFDLKNHNFALPKGLRFEEVKSDMDWTDWIKVIHGGFKSSHESDQLFLKLNRDHERKMGATYACFVLYVNDKPVSCCSITIRNHICRLDNIATIADEQGHGYGRIITEFGMQFAKLHGCQETCLEATGGTFEFYKKMGFQYLSKLEIYSKNDSR